MKKSQIVFLLVTMVSAGVAMCGLAEAIPCEQCTDSTPCENLCEVNAQTHTCGEVWAGWWP